MKKWIVSNKSDGISDITELLLDQRGIISRDEKQTFLNPPPALSWAKHFTSEFKKSLLEAKELINQTIEQDISIVIHGDYDADGINATAILYNAIKNDLNYHNITTFIPNRFDHGYGLSEKSIDFVIDTLKHPKELLIITVDSGITAAKETEYIKSKGYKVIITDHHQKSSEIPPADVLLWNDQLVGAGISWFLSKTLGSKDPQSIALAAIATVTDLQPLLNTNRSIVKEGLEVLNSNPPAGIKKLLQMSGRREGEVTTYDLGWVIGPRLNSTGRLVDASDSLLLLTEKDDVVLENAAMVLNETNNHRQNKTLEMYEFATISPDQEVPHIIISANQEYHEGIIGLVAAKLVQKYYRPSVVIALAEEYGKGSVRSIPGIDIISVLRQHEDLFISLGGHPMAAGFTIHKDNLPVLHERLNTYCSLNFDKTLFEPGLEIDLEIPLKKVNIDLAENIGKLKPFGIGNREPVFMSQNVGVAGMNNVGKEGKHTSFRLYTNNEYFKAIYFNGAEFCEEINVGDSVDLVYKIKEDEYNGNKKVSLVIEDLRKHV